MDGHGVAVGVGEDERPAEGAVERGDRDGHARGGQGVVAACTAALAPHAGADA